MRSWMLLLTLLFPLPVFAQAPSLGYVYPPAIIAGTTTEVVLGGYDFTPDMEFFVHDDRLELDVTGSLSDFLIAPPPYWFGTKGGRRASPIPREIQARFQVPADVPPGPVRWQVANANGSSATGVVWVVHPAESSSTGLNEIVEARYRDEPQELSKLPVAVSGRVSRIAEVDRYQFTPDRDGPVTIELFARRLGADWQALLEVRNADGQLITDTADTEGLDATLTFDAKADETYSVLLHDIDFRGNRAFIYRLVIQSAPRVVATIPARGQYGQTSEVTFIGYGQTKTGKALEAITREVTFPADRKIMDFAYELVTDRGEQVLVELPLSPWPESAQLNPKEKVQQFVVPGAVTANFVNRDSHSYTWKGLKGEHCRVTAQSRALGTRLDLAIVIEDADGKVLAEGDDLPGTPDAAVDLTLPADGIYTCTVRDLSGRAGSLDAVYRLAVVHAEPGFTLSVPAQLNAPVGGKATLTVKANRSFGYADEIHLELADLPAGVTVAEELVIPAKKSDLKIPVEVTEEIATQTKLIRIIGRDEQKTHEVVATSPASGNLCPLDPQTQTLPGTMLSITMPAPFELKLIDMNRQRPVHRGTTYPAEFEVVREENFAGPLQLQMASQQQRRRQGISGPTLSVPDGADRVLYPCFMPEWLETDRTTRMIVMGVAQVPDPTGRMRHLLKPATGRITMILEGALLKIEQQAPELTVVAGETFEVPLNISRSAKLNGPVKVSLKVPDELAGLLTAKTLQVSPTESTARLIIRTESSPEVRGRWDITVRAEAMQEDRWPVVSLTSFEVDFTSGVSAGSEPASN